MINNPYLTPEMMLIASASQRLLHWSTEESLPFWLANGRDPRGAFFEKLSLSGKGVFEPTTRVRVQARQTYCIALGSLMGARTDHLEEMCLFGVRVLTKYCRRMDGLYGRSIIPGKGLVDQTAELYDNAFALLAFATAYSAFGLREARQAGEALYNAIETRFAKTDPLNGYSERLPAPAIREQNPHMHLCEALLAWYKATNDRTSLERATQISRFVERCFFDRRRNILLEKASQDPEKNHYEIGHMLEWTWLLSEIARHNHRTPGPLFRRYYHGAAVQNDFQGSLPLSNTVEGKVIDDRQRTWVITELLKAHTATYIYQPSKVIAERISNAVDRLFDEHLNGAVLGGWIDERAPDGTALSSTMTAATGYHVYLAAFELNKLSLRLSRLPPSRRRLLA